MSAPKQVVQLVQRFGEHVDAYRSGKYNETQLRRDYLDPFLKCLGWDIDNSKGRNEKYRDVVHEDTITIAGKIKSPDYSFRIGGARKFFVEAKKPSIDIKNEPAPAYQLRRYGWSAKLPLSILTDFEELAVYDCRVMPYKVDRAAVARVYYWTYKDYIDRWNEISSLFSRDAVAAGSLDQYVVEASSKGTQEFDDVFLDEIEEWRLHLARDLARNNKKLLPRELNWAVQQIIDRIIFLRIAEDRGIEPYGQLQSLCDLEQVYAGLKEVFRKADIRYNSGLFHFVEEIDRAEPPDNLTLSLSVENKTLRDIFKHLYYPDSPYEFSVIGADILGSVYERFLGKVIRLTDGHNAKIEDKPEVKKAGGVYYTPTYVVDYIVKNTVGALLNESQPKDVEKIRIVDPACGSGSFLIAAYQHFLDWHLDWYIKNGVEKHAAGKSPKIHQGRGNIWRLTTPERKRILTANIYGVDIDSQAVEVTKLSLLLKMLEGETQLEMFDRRVLPDLGGNIKCGNSIVGTEFFQSGLFEERDEDDLLRVNPFDWKSGFSAVFKQGGFDAVIGNPPYRRELDYKELMDEIAVTELGRLYRSPRMDLWYYFVHRGLQILKKDRKLSFIVNAYWTSGTGSEKLISRLRQDAHLEEIFFFDKLKVFRDVSGQHMIIRLKNEKSADPTTIKLVDTTLAKTAEQFVTGRAEVLQFEKTDKQLYRSGKIDIHPLEGELLEKIEKYPALDSCGVVRQGIAENPSSINKKTNEKFGGRWEVGSGVFVLSPSELKKLKLPKKEQGLIRPYHDLRDIGRYFIEPIPYYSLIYSTRTTCPEIKNYPILRSHLHQYKQVMDRRRETENGSNSWWHLHWPRDEGIWLAPKVLSIQMGSRPSFVSAHDSAYVPFSVNVFVPAEGVCEDIDYFTSVLNSRVLWEWFKHHAKRRGVGLEINGNVLQRAPVRRIDFAVERDVEIYQELIELVPSITGLNEQLKNAKTPPEQEKIGRRIDSIDQRIDKLVAELYGLSKSEMESIGVGA